MRAHVLLLLALLLCGCHSVQRTPLQTPLRALVTESAGNPATQSAAAQLSPETPAPTLIIVPTRNPRTQATAEAVAAAFNRDEAATSLVWRAAHLLDMGDYENAEKYLTEALTVAPDSADARALRSIVRQLRGDVEGAQADAANINEAHLENPTVLAFHSVTLQNEGDFAGALAAIDKAIAALTAEVEGAGGDPHLYVYNLLPQRGRALIGLGRIEEGFADLDEAVRLSASSVDRGNNLFLRGLAYFELQDYEQVKRDLQEVLSLPVPPHIARTAEQVLSRIP